MLCVICSMDARQDIPELEFIAIGVQECMCECEKTNAFDVLIDPWGMSYNMMAFDGETFIVTHERDPHQSDNCKMCAIWDNVSSARVMGMQNAVCTQSMSGANRDVCKSDVWSEFRIVAFMFQLRIAQLLPVKSLPFAASTITRQRTVSRLNSFRFGCARRWRNIRILVNIRQSVRYTRGTCPIMSIHLGLFYLCNFWVTACAHRSLFDFYGSEIRSIFIGPCGGLWSI